MRKLLPITLLLLNLCSCKQAELNYDVVEASIYDVPAKSQYTERLVLHRPMDKAGLAALLNESFSIAMKRNYNYHNAPTHIFVYIYNSKADLARDGSSWVAMISRVMNKNEGIKFK